MIVSVSVSVWINFQESVSVRKASTHAYRYGSNSKRTQVSKHKTDTALKTHDILKTDEGRTQNGTQNYKHETKAKPANNKSKHWKTNTQIGILASKY